MTKRNNCRVCGNKFFKEPLLQYKNMPKGAQFLPGTNDLKDEFGVNLDIYQCSGCGLVQLDCEPVFYYKDVIRAAAFSDEMKTFRLQQFDSFVKKYSLRGKKVVEIGCGAGEYLSLMKECNVTAYGLEHLSESVTKCIKKGLTVSEGFIDNEVYFIKNTPFAAFYILNFFEHLPDPNSILKGIYNNLEQGGVGLVEVPNFDMILRKKLFSEFIPDHLFYFTKETLSLALNLNGFDILECNEIWYDYIISAVVKKRGKINISPFYKYQESLKAEIEKYIDQFGHKNVAIWGAGHQALAIISMTNISDKIRYVVDSATFKQGKYTPATHLPIVSPDVLQADPVKAIIVMAASYSDEVAKLIKNKFGININIAILRDFGLEVF
ncbi:methyltransferase [candidate division WOR-1 bacterium RIFOXYA2_FULL_36_21]|uniref:Methyltransferase n=1 Tax=candidate division WOR-1 bacterium RIFOXYB2_FULL_36_35 TaxID=1802578 RepID=A0A1F4S5A8_UNCSA|nr:MAG: methyltransferase [candidate division WOR-1 bacterium RIFOXYA2_FULL_36_21]OGC15622.1 MAG: methyltransferase [candidate division WOR-1 bacterium RIFOXYB2_FULL_36_35]OGC16370.1 MAG: methyltransferase [candidate division WOR-1 bacterium RIFOXYA12_FULL_36_13]